MKRTRMKAFRQRAGLTQQQVADRLMYSIATIRAIESGYLYQAGWTRRKLKLWSELAEMYGVSLEELGE